MSRLFLAMTLLLTLSACKHQQQRFSNEDLSAVDDETYSNETAIEVLSAKAEDSGREIEVSQTPVGNEIAVVSSSEEDSRLGFGLCREAIEKSECRSDGSSSQLTVDLNLCRIKHTRVLAEGQIQFKFNNPVCSIANDNEEVERTYELNLSKLAGFKAQVSSERHYNYLGQALGGGEVITNTQRGWDLQVLGQHRELYSRTLRKLADVSISTSGVISADIDQATKTKVLSGASLVIDHNIAKFSASYAPENLTWNDTCLCPVSGKLNIAFTGSKNGAGYLQFNKCGEVTVKRRNGEIQNLSLPRCIPE